ncbi:MAG: hypothetical protein RLZZ502_1868, partial [Pseudomonadota bacterium]
QGHCSVQDASAQIAAHLLDVQAGERILDACAAPGGKAAHLLERADIKLTAVEKDRSRFEFLCAQLERLGHTATSTCVHADAAATASWWDGKVFDRILLDAPCTGTGVLRRHPDGKLLKRAGDAEQLQQEQLRLLAALWPCLKPGGVLLYVTCSLLDSENEHCIAQFLSTQSNAQRLPVVFASAAWLQANGQCLPTLPARQTLGDNQVMGDALFFALLHKKPEPNC